jgi:alcohol dehydrogenase class IV
MFSLITPPKITFGAGSLWQTPAEIKKLGKKVLLIVGRKHLKQTGLLDKFISSLKQEGLQVSLFDQVEPEPCLETIDRGVDLGKQEQVEVIVGWGGGSVIDVGKVVAGILNKEGKAEDYQLGKRAIDFPGVDFVAIPTTAGTGAEATSNAVITNRTKKAKISIRSPFLLPRWVVIDPELTLTASRELKILTGIDTLVHLIEGFVSTSANIYTDFLALRGIELVAKNLPEIVNKEKDLSTQEKMCLAALLGGMVLTNAKLGAIHGLASPLGAICQIPHGLACALLLEPVIECNIKVRPEKLKQVAKIFGEEDCVFALKKFLAQLNFQPKLGALLDEEKIEQILARISGSIKFNPYSFKKEELKEILAGIE